MKNLSVTCIGAGVIGSGWAARLLVNGINVNVFDKHPESYHRTRSVSYTHLTLPTKSLVEI